jgi:hypothetical protein
MTNRKAIDESTEIIRTGIEQEKLGQKEKIQALHRLHEFLALAYQ